MLSNKAPDKIKEKCALIVGCGGLGCYVVEYLARIGLQKMILADDDCFCSSNMNRQLYSTKDTQNKSKIDIAKQRVSQINPNAQCILHKTKIDDKNIDDIALGCDIIFDCCDNVQTRLLLEKFCENKGLILIHGALNDVYGQVATVYPGDKTLSKLYQDFCCKPSKTLSYVPAIVAGYQVSEGIKALTGEGTVLKGQVMLIDLLNNITQTIG